jgi:hypothetical protein
MDLLWLAFGGVAAFAMLSLLSSERQRQTDQATAEVAAQETAQAAEVPPESATEASH